MLQILGALIVEPRRGVGILLLLVYAAGGDTVAEHLGYILLGHLAPADIDAAILTETVVDPVFKVVAVAALVMQPRMAHAVLDALGIIGAAVALIELDAPQKFGRGVFAQIVEQTLTIQTQLKAVASYPAAVGVDSFQMCAKGHPCHLLGEICVFILL